jgi:UDP-glucose:tetrahydrobiopterin glucosyltransferase
VPVIGYRRGGPAEIVRDGETGFLVEPDDIAGLVAAVGKLHQIDRIVCRQRVEEQYSTHSLAVRVDAWCDQLIDACQAEGFVPDQIH